MKNMFLFLSAVFVADFVLNVAIAEPRNGEITTEYASGMLQTKITYQNGVMQGKYEDYYENGNLKSQGQYINDKAEGVWYYYDNEGRRIRDAIWKNDEANGQFNEYYVDGTLKATGFFKNNVLNGKYTEYLPNGKDIYFYSNYKDGYLVGEYYGFGFYDGQEVFVHRAKDDKYFKDKNSYSKYESKVRDKNDNYNRYSGYKGLFTHYMRNFFGKDYGNSFGILKGDFMGGKFSGTISNNKGGRQLLTLKNGIPEGPFYGLLPKHIFGKIKNTDIFKKYYDKDEFLGNGIIKDNMFVGDISSAYIVIEDGKHITAYNPYVKGVFKDRKYSGYILNERNEFYTFKDNRLEGITFKKIEGYIEVAKYDNGIKKRTSNFDCQKYGKTCIYQLMGKVLNIYGPWCKRYDDDIYYYSSAKQIVEEYTGNETLLPKSVNANQISGTKKPNTNKTAQRQNNQKREVHHRHKQPSGVIYYNNGKHYQYNQPQEVYYNNGEYYYVY